MEKIEAIGKMGSKSALQMATVEEQGLDKWLEEYREENGMDAKELLANADSGMSKYDSAMQVGNDNTTTRPSICKTCCPNDPKHVTISFVRRH